jgi:hypothetical protein
MGNNQEICFVPGCGGHWLRALMVSLERNDFLINPFNNTFHTSLKSSQFYITHDSRQTNPLFFNGSAHFNIFLNFMNKNKIISSSVGDYIDIAARRAAEQLGYKQLKTDLDFNLIFVDQDRFINMLFDLMDNSSIEYTKNKDICYRAIEEYKKTCTDPELHFNNYESLEWLGWCLGIMKTETNRLLYATSITEATDLLISDRDYYKNYTVDKMVKLNG